MFRGVWLAALTLALGFSSLAFAGEVTKVKGRGVLISLSGDDANVGDLFFLLKDGKKMAIIRVTKVKGDQAIGSILKGKADVGMTTQKREGGGGKSAGGGGGGGGSSRMGASKKSYWGGMIGYSMDSMTVDLPSGATVSMTGSAFSAMGLFDYKLFNRGWFRGLGGYQGFQAQGSAICLGSTTCNMNASYIDLNFLFRYLFTDSAFRPWLGGGFGLMFPAAKSSTALDTGSISSTGIFIISGGLDWQISPTMYVPISLEYGMFPKSATVEASWITVRAGVAVPF